MNKPKFPVKELIKAGPAAPQVLVGHLVATQGPEIARKVAADRNKPGFEAEAYVDDLIKSHRRLARLQGAGGGAMIAAAEVPAVIGGPAAVAAAAATAILGDLVALAWIEQRLVMHIAAAYGQDLEDPARVEEFLSLAGVEMLFDGGATATGAAATSKKGSRFGVRAASRWAASKTFGAIKSMMQLVGARVARRVGLRAVPVLNIPLGVVLSDRATNRLGKRAREFYRTRPASV
ncbi:EcsC family protein [Nocardioides albertanoniae]|uniref:EcsC family protein n=1 Tax=Nocardioides albertanoniae TaxID=1175486 RepID=A0A543A4A6_9ACTN|nr:EcsC family protein [Nocardioides albertanoniae]TQL67419.1 EcsC family protein [Nocardioides albertanoniae]